MYIRQKLIYFSTRHMLGPRPLILILYKPSMRRQEKPFGHILSSALRKFDIVLPTFGKPVNVFLTIVKIVRKFHAPDDCINP